MGSFDVENKVWSGAKLPYPYPLDSFIGEEILKGLDATPDRILQINHDDQVIYTCRDVKLASIRVARNLIKLNIKSSQVVGLVCKNSSHLLPVLFGSFIAGAPFNPVLFAKDEIISIFSKSSPKIVFCDHDLYELTKESLDELKSDALIYTMIEKIPGVHFVEELLEPTGDEDEFVPEKFSENATEKLAAIMCSSGTTGPSKGCMIQHSLALALTRDKGLPFPYKSFTFSPTYWGTGVMGLVMAVFHPHETVVSTRKSFNIELLVEIVETYKIDVVFMAPAQLFLFLNSPSSKSADLSSVKAVASTGSICVEHIREKFKSTFPGKSLNIFYGLTEVIVSKMDPGQCFDGLQVGKVLPNTRVKVVDADGDALEIGKVGEIYVNSDAAFLGYFKDPEATEAAMTADGYFKTGDIGSIDEHGNVYLLDRQKHIFKCFSFHVSLKA